MLSRRPIRSFTRREGRMTYGQAIALHDHWPRYGLSTASGVLDPRAVFERDAPLVLEIGFGMGHSLLAMAKASPEQNFIGIDVHRPGVGALLAGMAEENLTNLRLYAQDATFVLQSVIPDHCLDKLMIFFPDPWPKKRHHKRRLIQAPFIAGLRQKLRPGGVLHIATDWENYAEQIEQVLLADEAFSLLDVHSEQYRSLRALRPETKFERRGKALGHRIWDFVAVS